ncbi:hypothetical protein MG290_10400 [Flavobacterium sp. CBA20B-1]|uniref:hypothetical protein n=1 Tax=unclassified Flavobacterium TaxID=196869 RepID=UPI002224DCE6|nr:MULTISPECIES: hypothetical protein [unclassified Flavobacterium]WCM41366.1 hypothetical protein MG290_10400 [Flavobacterium sp. CBA20B-1]
MLVYNLKKDLFIDTSEGELIFDEIIILAYCSMTEDFVLTLVGNNSDLCLHNEDESYDEIATKLFKLKDKKFKLHLDFFKTEITSP